MLLLKIVLFAIACVIAVLLVRQLNTELSTVLLLVCGIVILLYLCDSLYDVVYTIFNITEQMNIDSLALNCVIKVIGIGYIAEFGNNICVDANCKSIGDKVLLAGKVAILLCALPLLEQVFVLIKELIS